jgi:predicted O-methyltransferase YrrM
MEQSGPRKGFGSRRLFGYDRRLLPNPYLAELEPADVDDVASARKRTGLSIGYPAWNLLYYALVSSLVPDWEDPVVVETGTNYGVSTIVMAQALKDLGRNARVQTVDRGEDVLEIARENVKRAGLEDFVEFHLQDSLEFLRVLVERTDHIDFIFLDSNHRFEFVMKEVDLIHSKVAARGGKVYFDNTNAGGVGKALKLIEKRYGNVVRFENCSWEPPGNAIWQPR